MKHNLLTILFLLPIQIIGMSERNENIREIKNIIGEFSHFINDTELTDERSMPYHDFIDKDRNRLTNFFIPNDATILQENVNEKTSLELAVQHGSLKDIKLILRTIKNDGYEIDQQLLDKLLLLTVSSENKDAEKLLFLLSIGANPNIKNDQGLTPLMLCTDTINSNARMVKILLRHNARVNEQLIVNRIKKDALWYALINQHDINTIKTLVNHGAKIKLVHLKMIKKLEPSIHKNLIIQLMVEKEKSIFPATNFLKRNVTKSKKNKQKFFQYFRQWTKEQHAFFPETSYISPNSSTRRITSVPQRYPTPRRKQSLDSLIKTSVFSIEPYDGEAFGLMLDKQVYSYIENTI